MNLLIYRNVSYRLPIFWMLVKGINQRKHYSEANPFNARLNVFVSICSVGKKALRQLSQKKSQSDHHKISLTLTRVRIQNSLD